MQGVITPWSFQTDKLEPVANDGLRSRQCRDGRSAATESGWAWTVAPKAVRDLCRTALADWGPGSPNRQLALTLGRSAVRVVLAVGGQFWALTQFWCSTGHVAPISRACSKV